MATEKHPWVVGPQGQRIDLANPDPDILSLELIASSLSKICRWGGRSVAFYSVAQHSVHVSRLVPQEYAVHGLLHDAHEAIVGDLPPQAKKLLGESWRRLEQSWESAVYDRYRFTVGSDAVRHADLVALATERRDIICTNDHEWPSLPEPDWKRVFAYDWVIAREDFLERAWELGLR